MRLGLLCDAVLPEKRVALIPEDVKVLALQGFDVCAAEGAGEGAAMSDDAYREAGAIVVSAEEAAAADLVVSVKSPELPSGRPGTEPTDMSFAEGAVFVGILDPLWKPERARRLAETGVSAFSLDLVPRITRAQSMDVLSSMATIAGYEAVIMAAGRLPQMFPLMMTAGGTLTPARVLVLGAGVAGLQAIATARRLGAVVEGYDIRPAALEQIRSMGARTVEIDPSSDDDDDDADAGSERPDGYARVQSERTADRQRESLTPYVASADVVVTTAAIPGRASPLLLTASMIDTMRPGSVVVDLAAERGGNCEITQADTEIVRNGVTVLGPTDLTSRCARHASQMFSRNLATFLRHLAPEGEVVIDTEDEITAAMLVTHRGAVVHPNVAAAVQDCKDDAATTGDAATAETSTAAAATTDTDTAAATTDTDTATTAAATTATGAAATDPATGAATTETSTADTATTDTGAATTDPKTSSATADAD